MAVRAPMLEHEGGYYVRLAAVDKPGTAATIAGRMAEQGISLEERKAAILSGVALKGVISTPEDVANLALFLTSDQSRTITGQSINVDAGGVMVG